MLREPTSRELIKKNMPKAALWAVACVLIGFFLIAIVVIVAGPARLSHKINAWQTSGYGHRSLIVEKNSGGKVLNFWIIDGTIQNEESSDGIFFFDQNKQPVRVSCRSELQSHFRALQTAC